MKRGNYLIKIFGLLLTCFFKAMLPTHGQTNSYGLMALNSKPFHTELKLNKMEKVVINNYGRIIIKDRRPDNSKMGYVRLDTKSNPRYITFPEESEDYLNKVFNNSIRSKISTDTVLVILNDIWFNETITEAAMTHKLLLGRQKLVSSCYFNADVYKKANTGYIFLSGFDSIFTKKGEWLPNNCDKLLETVSISLLKTCDKLLAHSESVGNFYTEQQFDSILQTNSPFAILKTDKPAKGVYFSYGDFLNDKPAPINFRVISDIKNTIDYGGRNKEDTAWGYSDGENIFMHIGPAYYKLVRSKQTFEVLGPATVVIMNTFFEKAFSVAAGYFSSPRIPFNYFSPVGSGNIDPAPLFEPNKYVIEYFKYFRLDMKRGYLH